MIKEHNTQPRGMADMTDDQVRIQNDLDSTGKSQGQDFKNLTRTYKQEEI